MYTMKKFLVLFYIYSTIVPAQNNLTFPKEFLFGVASSAYQIEGAWNASEKGENIWDNYAHNHPDRIKDGSNGDVTCDQYHKIKEDVALLKNLGVNYYRFSLSWSRILPTGYINKINEDGIRYYNELIDELLDNGIQPMVSLYHWDLPQSLQEAGGWPNPLIADYFADYARVAFENFGDRVKLWITLNELYNICNSGYGIGVFAPGYKSLGFATYMCSYTLLLAHAKTYHTYDEEFRSTQKGKVGITFDSIWCKPKTTQDVGAAELSMQMNSGWFMHPIFSNDGDFPPLMKETVLNMSIAQNLRRSTLPIFTKEEIRYIKGTADFFGLNHYTTYLAEYSYESNLHALSHANNFGVRLTQPDDWSPTTTEWIKYEPMGLRKLLNWIKNEYNNPIVYITENGVGDDNGILDDNIRVSYYKGYLSAVLHAIHIDGCNVQAYTAWSFMDSFEWNFGYTLKFGLHYVNFTDPKRSRTPKASALYYRKVIESRHVNHDFVPVTNNASYMDSNNSFALKYKRN